MSMYTTLKQNIQSFKAEADLSSYQYRFGMLGTSANQVNLYDATSSPIGIIQDIENTSVGSSTDIAMAGGCAFLKLGGTVAKDGLISPNASGLGISSNVGGSWIAAKALEAGVVNDVIAVEVLPARVPDYYKAIWDFSVDGGAVSAISSDTLIPANFIITNAFYKVATTCTTAGADAGTMAISVESANDLVTATSVATATTWDDTAAAVKCISDLATVADYVHVGSTGKLVTFTIATQAFTAGVIEVFIQGVQGKA